jgi:hypothetical protein
MSATTVMTHSDRPKTKNSHLLRTLARYCDLVWTCTFLPMRSRRMRYRLPVSVEWDRDLGEVRFDNVTRFVELLQQK